MEEEGEKKGGWRWGQEEEEVNKKKRQGEIVLEREGRKMRWLKRRTLKYKGGMEDKLVCVGMTEFDRERMRESSEKL